MMHPIALFLQWYQEESDRTHVRIPSACCLSTIGLDGYPNARFVSLKAVLEDRFIVTGPLTSRKGLEIAQSNKVALTFWWTETERQVRIQGNATLISEELADRYFAERNLDAQIVSLVSDQGQKLESVELLNKKYEEAKKELIQRPPNWGGYAIDPVRLEFMTFEPTRFHNRKLCERIDGKWLLRQLQP